MGRSHRYNIRGDWKSRSGGVKEKFGGISLFVTSLPSPAVEQTVNVIGVKISNAEMKFWIPKTTFDVPF